MTLGQIIALGVAIACLVLALVNRLDVLIAVLIGALAVAILAGARTL